jgi:hypothetical protein
VEHKASIVGLVLGVLATPVAIVLGVASGGSGHGHYFIAKLLFPVTMLSTLAFKSITPPFILVAFVQFPIYGWFIASGLTSGARRLHLWIPIGVHLTALTLNFLIPNPSFS